MLVLRAGCARGGTGRRYCCELAVHVVETGCLCVWWRRAPVLGAGRWRCELAVHVVETGCRCWCWVLAARAFAPVLVSADCARCGGAVSWLAAQAAYILDPASRTSTGRGILPSYLGLCWCNCCLGGSSRFKVHTATPSVSDPEGCFCRKCAMVSLRAFCKSWLQHVLTASPIVLYCD